MTIALEELTLLHTRSYDTKVYRDGDHLVVVGSVQDVKPPGMYIADDPEPLEIHHMVVILRVRIGEMTITDAQVEFRTHPNAECPSITEHYGQLVGLSVTRGFNRKVRELLGGAAGVHAHDGVVAGDGAGGGPGHVVGAHGRSPQRRWQPV